MIERLKEYESFLAKQAKYHKSASEFETLYGSVREEMIAFEYEKAKDELYKLFPELEEKK